MSTLLDGLTVLVNNWQLTAGMFVLMLASQLLIGLALRTIFGDSLSASEYFSLGIAGWMAPLSLLSLLWIPFGIQKTPWIGISFLVILIILLLRLKPDLWTASGQRLKPASASTSLIFIFVLFVSISILLRLAYVSKTIFPLYFDSAQHYSMIKNIMGNDASGSFAPPIANYYHLGFHFLTAFFAFAFHTEATKTMLILGQMILAVVPVSSFFIVKHETQSNWAGMFAVVLSAFGWYMPGHVVDWGKYPALMGLSLIPFVLSLAYLFSQNKKGLFAKKRWMFYGMLGVSVLLTVFAHSRTLIVFGIVFLAWSIAAWWQKLPRRQMTFIFLSVIVVTILEIIFIQRQNVLALLFDPYLHKGILITIFVLLLSIFAWISYPRLTFVCVLTITFLLGSLFIPVPWIPGYRNLTLLDRPFVETILFLPLSLLGGLGLAGLEKKLQGLFSWGRSIGLLAMGIVLVNAFFTYELYPSDCCVIVGKDDVVAMDWMANQLPVDARIGISSTQLKVLASESFEGLVGGDAGIWVTPLIGRNTITLPNDLGFDQQPALDMLCQNLISHLFVGEVGQTFDGAKLNLRPEWYRPLLTMPITRVYEVTGCD